MRKIVIAPDSFKGSISSAEAARAIAAGVREFDAAAMTVTIPIADGGEGTLDALTKPGDRINVPAFNTHGEPRNAEFGYIGKTAVIESASAVGLGTVDEALRCPEISTTKGVGTLILAALDRGFERIMLTVGGTGSNDGGAGMLGALGTVFYGDNGEISNIRAYDLKNIRKIDISALDRRLYRTEFIIACDVNNPLTGTRGATYVYGPQKGADSEMLRRLEDGIINYSEKLAAVSRDVSEIPGAGAGGGLPVPLMALFGARILSGIDAVLDAVGFDAALEGASLVITGEGRLDAQSANGKAIGGVAARAAARGIPVAAIAGQLGDGADTMRARGIYTMYALTDIAPCAEYAIANAAALLTRLGRQAACDFFEKK